MHLRRLGVRVMPRNQGQRISFELKQYVLMPVVTVPSLEWEPMVLSPALPNRPRPPAAGLGRRRQVAYWDMRTITTPLSRTPKVLSTRPQSFTAHRSLSCRYGESKTPLNGSVASARFALIV